MTRQPCAPVGSPDEVTASSLRRLPDGSEEPPTRSMSSTDASCDAAMRHSAASRHMENGALLAQS
jgi:hypothetical protein